MDITFHYPPELLQLLVDTIPRLCRSKNDVLTFFKGAGVSRALTDDVRRQLSIDAASVNKFHITRTILIRLNEAGEARLRERREVIKRVVEFEDFSTCWPNDQLTAKGLVAEIRRVVAVKDSFTRMSQEREKEATERRTAFETRQIARRETEQRLQRAKDLFNNALTEKNSQRRGSLLEPAINGIFDAYGISVRESFRVVLDKSASVLEQGTWTEYRFGAGTMSRCVS